MAQDLLTEFKKWLSEKLPVRLDSHRRVDLMQAPPAFTAGLESLYGIPLFDLLEGYKGQVVGVEWLGNYTDYHYKMPTTAIRFKLGISMFFGRARLRRGEIGAYTYPMVVLGLATPYVDLLKMPGVDFVFEEYRIDTGEFVVAVDDILNLNQVAAGDAAALITDKYHVRSLERISEAERLRELSHITETLTYELQKAQIKAEEESRNARMAINMAEFYRRQMEEAHERVEKLAKQFYDLREEFERLLSSYREKIAQLETQTELSERAKAIARSSLDTLQDFAQRIRVAGESLKAVMEATEVKLPGPKEGG
ncbi:MAG: hypothetical protein DRJ38_01910 [Thermoprotei archaeon]|nr:MAG: hypothetical protein DRJ38_01910 [Thermoprotei archaeon]